MGVNPEEPKKAASLVQGCGMRKDGRWTDELPKFGRSAGVAPDEGLNAHV